MKASDRLINIIEDHANITQFLDQVCCALENGTEMPNFVPVLHDTLVTDQLGVIAENLNKHIRYGKCFQKD